MDENGDNSVGLWGAALISGLLGIFFPPLFILTVFCVIFGIIGLIINIFRK